MPQAGGVEVNGKWVCTRCWRMTTIGNPSRK
jgi:hypothetical protein